MYDCMIKVSIILIMNACSVYVLIYVMDWMPCFLIDMDWILCLLNYMHFT